jgi:hypothetical protein
MKKVILAICTLVILGSANAQKGQTQNVIKANPLGLFFGSANIAYERALGEKSSVVIAPSFGSFKLSGFKYSSFGFGAEYRLYLGSSTAPAGTYFAPGLGYTTGKVKVDDFSGSGSEPEAKFGAFVGKVVIGKQWIWGGGFTLDLNGGIQYLNYSYSDNTNSVFGGLSASGILPALGLSIGYAF